ncbi:ferredoxin reductase-like protein [Violaceomyces palustris]|uniref:Ferredoxin reductase-like protein n=1 Tax=Violaceomyces palustris TaxID=1673888 RepID=A0ACD0P2J8_9BASI|nr:ferredoxin reductase-like protein [Violaceomyces palustris]
MFIRPALTSTLAQAAKSTARSQWAPLRTYATEAGKPSGGKESNTPLFLALGGLAGLGAWYAMGGFGDGKQVPAKVQEKGQDLAQKAEQAVGAGGALRKDAFVNLTLKEVKPYNHDSSTFIFEIPDNQKPGTNVASAILLKAADDSVKDKEGKSVIRPYTPTSSPDTAGEIELLVKKYENGLMTTHIHNLKPGDKLGFKGPIPKWQYKANEFEHIGMIAGGSGITPMWQVIQQIASDPNDKTQVTLVYTNKTEKDILLREQFDKLAKTDNRFKVVYGLDQAPKGWNGFTGYATPEVLYKHLPLPALADKAKIFVCGPPGQVQAISGGKGPKGSQGELKGILADMGYQADQVYKF